jgi:hypothetical protein
MRGQSIAVVILTVAVFAGGVAPVRAAEEAVAPAQAAPQADYYTRRAESVIEAEKKGTAKPHPLAAAHPGFDVVVCEAGCPVGRTPEIVFARRETEREKVATQGELVPTSSQTNAKPGDDEESNLACIAGCYDRTAAVEERDDVSTPWSTSVAPAVAAPEKPAVPVRDKLSPIR